MESLGNASSAPPLSQQGHGGERPLSAAAGGHRCKCHTPRTLRLLLTLLHQGREYLLQKKRVWIYEELSCIFSSNLSREPLRQLLCPVPVTAGMEGACLLAPPETPPPMPLKILNLHISHPSFGVFSLGTPSYERCSSGLPVCPLPLISLTALFAPHSSLVYFWTSALCTLIFALPISDYHGAPLFSKPTLHFIFLHPTFQNPF